MPRRLGPIRISPPSAFFGSSDSRQLSGSLLDLAMLRVLRITSQLRDPEDSETFWVNPFDVQFDSPEFQYLISSKSTLAVK
jgi:hypothetical protein